MPLVELKSQKRAKFLKLGRPLLEGGNKYGYL
jgi:hypothetical protein